MMTILISSVLFLYTMADASLQILHYTTYHGVKVQILWMAEYNSYLLQFKQITRTLTYEFLSL